MTDETLVEALNDIEAGLSTWELDFLESITDRVDAGHALTDKRRGVAERILAEKGL